MTATKLLDRKMSIIGFELFCGSKRFKGRVQSDFRIIVLVRRPAMLIQNRIQMSSLYSLVNLHWGCAHFHKSLLKLPRISADYFLTMATCYWRTVCDIQNCRKDVWADTRYYPTPGFIFECEFCLLKFVYKVHPI